jgi:hypothetical protein
MWGTPRDPQQDQGDRFREQEAWNKRLIIRPIQYIEDIKKLDTRGDALRLNVVDLDDPSGQPRLYRGILWFSGPLVGTFKDEIGTPFLGYITKEKNAKGYMAWKFYDLSQDPDTDARAQAWLAANPDFLDPIQPAQRWGAPDTSHHERGPAPSWAGPVAPPAPPRPGGGMTPPPPPPGVGGPVSAPPPPPVSAPPSAPQSAPPAPAPANPGDIMARLRRQAGLPESGGNVPSGDQQEAPF